MTYNLHDAFGMINLLPDFTHRPIPHVSEGCDSHFTAVTKDHRLTVLWLDKLKAVRLLILNLLIVNTLLAVIFPP